MFYVFHIIESAIGTGVLYHDRLRRKYAPHEMHFARLAGFEPVTYPVTGDRSNQLSYSRNMIKNYNTVFFEL